MNDDIILNDHNKEEIPPAHTAEHLLNQTMQRLFGGARLRKYIRMFRCIPVRKNTKKHRGFRKSPVFVHAS